MTRGNLLLAGLGLLGAISCIAYDDPTPPAGTPCIEVAEGLRFEATLVEDYNASSNTLYSASILPTFDDAPFAGSCQGMDGLTAGSQFEFTTGRYSPAYSAPTCSYREMESVFGIGVSPGKYAWAVAGMEGQSFAGWTRTARLAGVLIPYKLLVIAPTGNPFGSVVRAQLPPAVVVRYTDDCRDDWVATLTELTP